MELLHEGVLNSWPEKSLDRLTEMLRHPENDPSHSE